MLNDVGLTFGVANFLNDNAIGGANFQAWSDGANLEGRPSVASATCRARLPARWATLESARPGGSSSPGFSHASRIGRLRDVFEVSRFDAPREPAEVRRRRWQGPASTTGCACSNRNATRSLAGGVPLMFLIAPILWLQSWASPGLHARHGSTSRWFGYTRTAIALAAHRVRLSPTARDGAAAPARPQQPRDRRGQDHGGIAKRPFAVDPACASRLAQRLPRTRRGEPPATGWWDPPRRITAAVRRRSQVSAPDAADSDEGFGFPSGHVSTTATLLLGLAG